MPAILELLNPGPHLPCPTTGGTHARLADLIARAHIRAPRRVKTKPSRAAKAKRVDTKKQRGSVKEGRGKVRLD